MEKNKNPNSKHQKVKSGYIFKKLMDSYHNSNTITISRSVKILYNI